MLQTSVEIVNPGGTGRPALVISASPEPLPPRRSFMWRLPSALPFPKKYAYLRDLELEEVDFDFFGAVAVGIVSSVARKVDDWWVLQPDRSSGAIAPRSAIPRMISRRFVRSSRRAVRRFTSSVMTSTSTKKRSTGSRK